MSTDQSPRGLVFKAGNNRQPERYSGLASIANTSEPSTNTVRLAVMTNMTRINRSKSRPMVYYIQRKSKALSRRLINAFLPIAAFLCCYLSIACGVGRSYPPNGLYCSKVILGFGIRMLYVVKNRFDSYPMLRIRLANSVLGHSRFLASANIRC